MLISILIPCYNAKRWIGSAIESALAQTWPQKEVIVVDDGSQDGSLDIVKSYGNRIYWEAGPNRGGNIARNRLLQLAKGEWLQYLDADDYLLPNKITEQAKFLATIHETDIIFSPVIKEHWKSDSVYREQQPIEGPYDPWILLARWYLPQTGGPLWSRSALLDVNGWKVDQPCCQEHELYLRLLKAGKRFTYCPAEGAIYRQWSNETVCTKNIPEVNRRRLEIIDGVEEFLSKSSQLTPQRQWAVSIARFEIARMVWLYDPNYAKEIVTLIKRRHAGFIPTGPAAPGRYGLFYRLLGFDSAERIALFKRNVAHRMRA